MTTSARKHRFHRCDDDRCNTCGGGLYWCTVCGQAEAELENTCPGRKLSRVYVASTWRSLIIADGSLVAALRAAGAEVLSRWHDEPAPANSDPGPEERRWISTENLADLDSASVIVAVPCAGHHMRGAHFEMGYATGKNKPVVILGRSGDFNTMTETPDVLYAESVEALLRVLQLEKKA